MYISGSGMEVQKNQSPGFFSTSNMKSLIEEHACLDFSDFLSTLLAFFHVINEKFHPAGLPINLLSK